jgi:hypothetical protein
VLRSWEVSSLDAQNWPEGNQICKVIHNQLPENWGHSEWSWQLNGYLEKSGSVGPKLNKAECCRCLGVLQCQGCEQLVRPNTKTDDMKAQLAKGCLSDECGRPLLQIPCKARCYSFVVEEDGVQYSIWEHVGSHRSHPRPPPGRKLPPCSRKAPDKAMGHGDTLRDPLNKNDRISGSTLSRQTTPANVHPQATPDEVGTSHDHSATHTTTRKPKAIPVHLATIQLPSHVQPHRAARDAMRRRQGHSRTSTRAHGVNTFNVRRAGTSDVECEACSERSDGNDTLARPVCKGAVVWKDEQYIFFTVFAAQTFTRPQHWAVRTVPNSSQGQMVCRQDHCQEWANG